MTRPFPILILVSGLATLSAFIVFNGVFAGKVISNNFYLFAHEPWAHHIVPGIGNYNYMLSDDVDVMSVSFPTAYHLRNGEFPLWNHYWQLGIPEFRIDSGWFYPLRWFWLLFGIPWGMTVEVLVRHALAVFFTFLLLEALKIHRTVALIAAVSYSYGSTPIGDYMFGFGPISLALPIALYFVERLIQKPKLSNMVWAMLSWCYLNTHIMLHVNFLASAWLATYALLRVYFFKSRGPALKYVAGSVVFAIALSAFMVLPTLHYYLHYFNSSYREGYCSQQLNIGSLLTIFYNSFFGIPLLEKGRYSFGSFTGSAVFVGFLTGLGAVCFATVRLFKERDQYIIPVFIVLFALLFTTYDFPYENLEFFFSYVPLLKFTPPYYQRPIFQFFLMLAGALGLDFFYRKMASGEQKLIYLGVLWAFVVVSIATYLWNYSTVGQSKISFRYFLSVTVLHIGMCALFIAFCTKERIERRTVLSPLMLSIILLFSILESMLNASGWIPYLNPKYWYHETQTIKFVKERLQPGERVISLGSFAVPSVLFGERIPVAAGRSYPRQTYLELLRSAYPGIYKDHPTQSLFPVKETDLRSNIWDLLNVNFFLANKSVDIEYLKETFQDSITINQFIDGTVIERKNRGKQVAISSRILLKPSMKSIIKELNTPTALAESPFYVLTGDFSPGTEPGCSQKALIKDLDFTLNRISLTVQNRGEDKQCSSYLVFSMFYNEGWKARVNGEDTEVGRAYGFLPIIRVEGVGEHTVTFSFFPPWLRIGLIITALGLISLVLLFSLSEN
jgi:hypothetical protein